MTEPRTKIHCTCGPACRDVEVLRAMIRAGADVFRVNGAHADGDEIAGWIELVREAARAEARAAAVLVDLPGPKFRVGALAPEAGFELAPGAPLRMDGEEAPGDGRRVPLREMHWFADIPVGASVVVGDGGARLEVVSAGARGIELRAIDAVGIREGVGVHFPGLALPTAVPTRRDRVLLKAAVEAGADMISQSFVRTPDDVARLRELVRAHGGRRTLVIAKIERLDAVLAADAILAQADGALLGRGDLGIDAGVEAVPSLQKRVLEAGRRTGRPVVIATEMLESMVHSLRPTRAEASDVAGAVYEGADGVMLSAETAIGRHPAHVVATMAGILVAAEADPAAPVRRARGVGGPSHARGATRPARRARRRRPGARDPGARDPRLHAHGRERRPPVQGATGGAHPRVRAQRGRLSPPHPGLGRPAHPPAGVPGHRRGVPVREAAHGRPRGGARGGRSCRPRDGGPRGPRRHHDRDQAVRLLSCGGSR